MQEYNTILHYLTGTFHTIYFKMVLSLKRIFPTCLHFYKEELKRGKVFYRVSTTKMFLKEKYNKTFVCPQNVITVADKSRLLVNK